MGTETFTKGPWFVDDRFPTCIRSASGSVVANTDNGGQGANARLISATPEMFDGLLWAIELIRDRVPEAALHPEFTLACAAIAKAEGR